MTEVEEDLTIRPVYIHPKDYKTGIHGVFYRAICPECEGKTWYTEIAAMDHAHQTGHQITMTRQTDYTMRRQ